MLCNDMDEYYRSVRWKKLREKILRRDGYQCQVSKRYGKAVEADTVHHIFPRQDYPEYQWEPWNLISVSAAVHGKLHDKNTNKLTALGMELMERTARRRGL